MSTWAQFSGSGANPNATTGTVTSVTVTGDGIVDSSTPSAAVTASGTLTLTAKTQTANTVLAGPTSGGAVAPTFRAVVSADIPSSIVLANGITATTQAQADASTKLATTAYTDTAVANAVAGVNPAVAVLLATTAAGDTSGLTYNNGVAGVGATLTGSVNTAITIDGTALTSVNQRILVKNDTQSPSGAFNGVYFLTQLQTGILAPILTRALDYNSPSDINNTGAIPVQSGTANASTSWLLTSSVTTVGTSPLTFVQFSIAPGSLVTASSPGVGIAHFAGSTQAVTSSLIVGADISSSAAIPSGVTATTQTAGDNSTKLATTAYVDGAAAKRFTWPIAWGVSAAQAPAQNATKAWSFYIPYTITASKIGYYVQTADNTANVYDIGIYGSGAAGIECLGGNANVPLAAHCGPTAGTTVAPSTGAKTIAITGAPITFYKGWYGLAITSSAASPALVLAAEAGTNQNVSLTMFVANNTVGSTSSGTLASTVTAPSTTESYTAGLNIGLFP